LVQGDILKGGGVKSSFNGKQLTRSIALGTTLRTMGQQLRQRNKQRRRVLRKKRIAERNRAAATKK